MVSTSGTVSTNRPTIAGGNGDQRFPSSAFDGSSYLVAWNDGFLTTNLNLVFRFFNRAGQPLGQEFSPFAAQGTNQPAIGGPLFDGTKFLAVGVLGSFINGFNAASGDVYGTFISRSTAAPQLDVAGPLAGSKLSLVLTATPGITYSIQAVTSLSSTNWVTVLTQSLDSSTLRFTDNNATNRSRFYRAVMQ